MLLTVTVILVILTIFKWVNSSDMSQVWSSWSVGIYDMSEE